MKKKAIYTSVAFVSALFALVSCGKKTGGGKTPSDTSKPTDSGVTLSIDRNHYQIDYTNPNNGNVTFYSVEYAKDTKTGDYYVDDNGNYYYENVSLGSINIPGQQTIDYLPTPKRDGFTFVGWYVDEGLGTEFYYDKMPNGGNLVAYARWARNLDTIYVSPDGSPFNTGEKASKALTLNEAARSYKAGATIILEEGTYRPKDTVVLGNNGDSENITTINGNNATIEFQQQEDDKNYGIKLTGDFTNINDLTIKKAGDNGLLLGSSNNTISNCVFTQCHDTGLQISRYSDGVQPYLDQWPSNNLILNCTSFNNKDDACEDADGFAAKLTVGQGNIFDGCLAYWNIDDGWDLYAKADSGRIGTITLRNCVSVQNGHSVVNNTLTEDYGDGNGFKLGGSSVPGEVIVDNCIAAYNYAHGFTDNSNPGVFTVSNCTSINNGQYGDKAYDNFNLNRDGLTNNKNYYSGLVSYYNNKSKNTYTTTIDEINGSIADSIIYQSGSDDKAYPYYANGPVSAQAGTSVAARSFKTSKNVSQYTYTDSTFDATDPQTLISTYGTNWHTKLRNSDNSLNVKGLWSTKASFGISNIGANLSKSSSADYTHSEQLSVENVDSDTLELRNAYNSLNLAINSKYIYNDIYLPTHIGKAKITWASSKSDIISISSEEKTIENGVSYTYGLIADRVNADTEVTLTATISYNNKTLTKTFNVTAQGLDPRIGKITGIDSTTLLNTETLPEIESYVVYDYVSTRLALITGTDYQVSYTIGYSNEYYANPASGTYSSVTALSANKCGTYKITYTFKVAGYQDTVVTRYITLVNAEDTYEVCNAATSLGFIIDDSLDLNVNANYNAGTIYAIASSENLTNADAQKIIDGTLEGAVSDVVTSTITSRDFALHIDFNNSYVANTSVYAYLVVVNENGVGEVYKSSEILPTTLISTAEELYNALNDSSNSSKAFKLANDIDCNNADWKQSESTPVFKGYFDGAGHTIENLNIEVEGTDGGGLFFKADNQAIIKNIRLEEVHVFENEKEAKESDKYGKTAILVGEVKGGAYIENIYIHNCSAKAYQRVGGIVGQYSGTTSYSASLTIKNIVIDTDAIGTNKYSISANYDGTRGGKYVGGILAHAQYSGSGNGTKLYIENCYVNLPIYTVNQYSGGIVGRVDLKQDDAEMTIKNSVFAGSLTSTSSYAAGILGGRSSGPAINIINCVNRGLINGSSTGMIVSQQLCNKQTVGTEKWYSINTDYVNMDNCYWVISDYTPGEEYASEEAYIAAVTLHKEYYGIATYSSNMTKQSWWESNGYDFDSVFTFNNGTFKLAYFNVN